VIVANNGSKCYDLYTGQCAHLTTDVLYANRMLYASNKPCEATLVAISPPPMVPSCQPTTQNTASWKHHTREIHVAHTRILDRAVHCTHVMPASACAGTLANGAVKIAEYIAKPVPRDGTNETDVS